MKEKTNREERNTGILILTIIIIGIIVVVGSIIHFSSYYENDNINYSTEVDWQYEGMLEACCMENNTLFLSLHNNEGLSFHNFSDEKFENLSSFVGSEIRIYSHSEEGIEIIDNFYKMVRIKSITNVSIKEV